MKILIKKIKDVEIMKSFKKLKILSNLKLRNLLAIVYRIATKDKSKSH